MKKKESKSLLSYDLQFFADDDPGEAQPQESAAPKEDDPSNDPSSDAKKNDGEKPPEPKAEKLSIEEQLAKLQKEIANERAKSKMLEKKLDKTKESEEKYRTAYNETLTETQKAEQEKLERDAKLKEEFEQLRKESAVNKLLKNYLKLGYPEDKAEEIATATYEGDQAAVFRIQSEVDDIKRKAWELEFMKNNPQIVTGAGDGQGEEDPFIKGFKSAAAKWGQK